MDPERLDGFAKTLARGASRRTLMAAILGLSAGALRSRFALPPDAHAAQDCGFLCPDGQILDATCTCAWATVADCAGLTDCGGICVDTFFDAFNCGVCGNVCASGVCNGGLCADAVIEPIAPLCDVGFTDCGGICVDLYTDPFNCGWCGNVCSSGLCNGAACVVAELAPIGCDAGLTDCVGVCTDLLTDPANCNGCGLPCESGSCTNGLCDPIVAAPAPPPGCLDPYADCLGDGTCIDLSADANHCGGCGNACENGLCIDRVCSTAQPPIQMRAFCPFTDGACEGPDSCFDTNTDPNHCGGCGNRCESGSCTARVCDPVVDDPDEGVQRETCDGNVCWCPEGLTYCFGWCVDTNTDWPNCGGCGNECETELCVGGICQRASCDPPLTDCGGVCANLDDDSTNCGACGSVCPGDPSAPTPYGAAYCVSGECALECGPDLSPCYGRCLAPDACQQPGCEAGLAECGGACVDLASDPAHCGGCGIACASGQCSGGACTQPRKICAEGRTDCCAVLGDDGYDNCCVNLQSNFRNCGGCGQACSSGEHCQNGSCVAEGCVSGLTECDGACVELETDPDHCGACGQVCGSGRCEASACVPEDVCGNRCADGDGQFCCAGACCGGIGMSLEQCCDDRCVDTGTDPVHCGFCGHACLPSEQCINAACVRVSTPAPTPTPITTPERSPTQVSTPPVTPASATCARPLCNGVCCRQGEECVQGVTGLECIPFVCIGRGPNCQPTPVPSPAGQGRVVVARQGRGLIQGFVEVDVPAHAVVGISPRNGLHVTLHLKISQTHISEFGAHNDTPWANFNKTCAGGDAKWVARFDDGGTLAIEARVTDEDVEMSLLMLALEAFFPDEALEAITCSTVETFFNLVDALNNSEHFNSALAITIHPTDMLDQEKRERAANELVLFLTQDAFEIFEVLAPYVGERAPDALLQFIFGGWKRGIDVLIAGIERLRGEYLTYQLEGPDRVEFAVQQ